MKKTFALLGLLLLSLLFTSQASAASLTNRYYVNPTANTSYLMNDAGSVTLSRVTVMVQIASTINVSGSQTGTAYLETSIDGSTDWVEEARVTSGLSGTVVIGLGVTNTVVIPLVGEVSYERQYYRIRTTGTATITLLYGTEIW